MKNKGIEIMINNELLKNIKDIHEVIKLKIDERIQEFKMIGNESSEEEFFCELVFCLMTPQSKAKSCGAALEILKEKNLIFKGEAEEISNEINIVRFKNNKARYIVEARKNFTENGNIVLKSKLNEIKDVYDKRKWLVDNIKGLGYKEASHFLRNVGYGEKIAILDRHILKNLMLLGVIENIPKTLSPKIYLDIEKKLLDFSKEIFISPDHLDFVLWYKEAGDVYK